MPQRLPYLNRPGIEILEDRSLLSPVVLSAVPFSTAPAAASSTTSTKAGHGSEQDGSVSDQESQKQTVLLNSSREQDDSGGSETAASHPSSPSSSGTDVPDALENKTTDKFAEQQSDSSTALSQSEDDHKSETENLTDDKSSSTPGAPSDDNDRESEQSKSTSTEDAPGTESASSPPPSSSTTAPGSGDTGGSLTSQPTTSPASSSSPQGVANSSGQPSVQTAPAVAPSHSTADKSGETVPANTGGEHVSSTSAAAFTISSAVVGTESSPPGVIFVAASNPSVSTIQGNGVVLSAEYHEAARTGERDFSGPGIPFANLDEQGSTQAETNGFGHLGEMTPASAAIFSEGIYADAAALEGLIGNFLGRLNEVGAAFTFPSTGTSLYCLLLAGAATSVGWLVVRERKANRIAGVTDGDSALVWVPEWDQNAAETLL